MALKIMLMWCDHGIDFDIGSVHVDAGICMVVGFGIGVDTDVEVIMILELTDIDRNVDIDIDIDNLVLVLVPGIYLVLASRYEIRTW